MSVIIAMLLSNYCTSNYALYCSITLYMYSNKYDVCSILVYALY